MLVRPQSFKLQQVHQRLYAAGNDETEYLTKGPPMRSVFEAEKEAQKKGIIKIFSGHISDPKSLEINSDGSTRRIGKDQPNSDLIVLQSFEKTLGH